MEAHAEIENTPRGRELHLHLDNRSNALAFQLRAAVRTGSGELIAPVLLVRQLDRDDSGESVTLTALLPESMTTVPAVQVEGWNIAPLTLTPTPRRRGTLRTPMDAKHRDH